MNNQDKNTYVKRQITNVVISLLKEKKLEEISVKEVVEKAQVARASFYRNYSSISDVLQKYDAFLVQEWGNEFESDPSSSVENVFVSLFLFYQRHSEFYLLLYRCGLTECMLHTILSITGPREEMEDSVAFQQSFFSYGLYGILVEWMKREMKGTKEEISSMFLQKS